MRFSRSKSCLQLTFLRTITAGTLILVCFSLIKKAKKIKSARVPTSGFSMGQTGFQSNYCQHSQHLLNQGMCKERFSYCLWISNNAGMILFGAIAHSSFISLMISISSSKRKAGFEDSWCQSEAAEVKLFYSVIWERRGLKYVVKPRQAMTGPNSLIFVFLIVGLRYFG